MKPFIISVNKPLIISVTKKTWQCHHEESLSTDTLKQYIKCFKRDNFTCQYCGFIMPYDTDNKGSFDEVIGYMNVHHINDDHKNNDLDNIDTICPLCHQVFHAGNTGYENTKNNAVSVIYLPFLTQNEINLTLNLVMNGMMSKDASLKESSESIYMTLSAYEDHAAMIFDEMILDPLNLAASLMDISEQAPHLYAKRQDFLKGLRLLPDPDYFKEQVKFWQKKGTWLPDNQWAEVLSQWEEEQAEEQAEEDN